MATTDINQAKRDAADLSAPANASTGLTQLVIAVRSYITWCLDLLGSGDPSAAPDFSDLITNPATSEHDKGNYKNLADNTDTSQLSTVYNQNVKHVENVNSDLVRYDKGVGGQVSDVAGIAGNACKNIDGSIGDLRAAIPTSLPTPISYKDEGPIIHACFKAVDDVYTDMQDAATQIQRHAGQVDGTQPPVVQTSYHGGDGGAGAGATPTYTTPLSDSQIQGLIGGVTDSTKKKFLDTALKQAGDPYVYGAEGPNAFDCSGLVQYSAQQAGIKNMPRTASEQYYATRNHPVSPADLQPGDLIFPDAQFNEAGGPGHVMIYVGNGQVVEAPHTGDHVKVITLSSVGGYHATRF
ncbi:C40 family peptidase [Nocardia sp. BMG111209]|uniref:C40 family peptidase n=1 Tax=Nocardia sp. BMG111209 TaxID=1160137 RepID=UPI000360A4F3|nr:C40 family peptidase [Nocardia sp. BMG111209]